MKQLTIIIALLLTLPFFFTSCGGNSDTNVTPSTTGTSTFSITFNGKTYSGSQGFTLNSSGQIDGYTPLMGIQMVAQTVVSSAGADCTISSSVSGNYSFSVLVLATGRNTPTGQDTLSSISTGDYNFIDIGAGNIIYSIDSCIVNVTESDSDWVAGTMNLTLTLGSTHYPATATFKITAHV